MNDTPNTVLQVQGLGKRYRLYATPRQRLMALLGWADHSRAHWALQDVSFALTRGQCLGVIGDNGAGKSTLLKLLAGTLQPSHGALQREGRVTAILELGAGFHPDFTGRENLMYGGSLIGLNREEMLRLSDEIIAFSELGDAVDRPVKTYSSGMVVRLAFALVTAVQPEVLIIDEALAVGDQHFQMKCVQRITEFRQRGCTILFCSHSMYHVRQLCGTVLWLDQGKVKALGDTDTVLAKYEAHVRVQEGDKPQTTPHIDVSVPQSPQPLASDRKAALAYATVHGLVDAANADAHGSLAEQDLKITVQATTSADEAPSIAVMIEQYKGTGITSVSTHADGATLTKVPTEGTDFTWQTTLTFTQLPLHSGTYVLSFYLFDGQGLVVFDEWKDHIVFDWSSPSLMPGLVRLPHVWS
jgi:lipopolysaccharide transport system ATP-binding protein